MIIKKITLIIGDMLSIAVLTIIGFATHGEVGSSFLRMGTTFFPLSVAWFLSAPWLGLFNEQIALNPKMFWRILFAMLFAAPLAVILRAFFLHGAALPLFVLVLGGMNALGLLVWRGSYLFVARRLVKLPG